MAKLDHLVLVTGDLDMRAKWLWETFGLETQSGGEHDGAGTANRYVPLGDDQYLELLAIADPASKHPMVTTLKRDLVSGDRLLNFAIATDDIEAVAKRLNEQVFDVVARRLSPPAASHRASWCFSSRVWRRYSAYRQAH